MTIRLKAVLTMALLTVASAQTLTFSNDAQTYATLTATTVNLTNRCELWVTATTTPLAGCTINLNSVDTCLVLPGIKPSVVATATYLNQIKISGAAAVADSNCRVVGYAMGTIVLPHSSSFQPLTLYSAPYFSGTSLTLSNYVYYKTGRGANWSDVDGSTLTNAVSFIIDPTGGNVFYRMIFP